MSSGQVTLNRVTDAQLEAILDIKKNNEGAFTLVSLLIVGQPGSEPPLPPPSYYPGSPWGTQHGFGVWYGLGSPYGSVPPNFPHLSTPTPAVQSTEYNVTLAWSGPNGMKVVAQVFEHLGTLPN